MAFLDQDESSVHQRLIIVSGHKSISAVEEPGYKEMMRGLPCRKSVSKLVTRTAIVETTRLKELAAGEDVSLTCDGWTSGNGLGMMGVTAYWINKDRKLVFACLDVFELPGSHNGISQCRLVEAVKGVMAPYDITGSNVIAVTTDTAAN
eukprot:jgi/Undpi1/5599/HiC_scaffold_2.g00875.m1